MLFSYKKEDAAVAAAAVKFLCNRFYQKSLCIRISRLFQERRLLESSEWMHRKEPLRSDVRQDAPRQTEGSFVMAGAMIFDRCARFIAQNITITTCHLSMILLRKILHTFEKSVQSFSPKKPVNKGFLCSGITYKKTKFLPWD